MRHRINILSLAVSVVLSSCASGNRLEIVESPRALSNASGRSLTVEAWVVGSREVQIFFDPSKVGNHYEGDCVSGLVAAGSSLVGLDLYFARRSRITMTLVASGSLGSELGGGFENYCGLDIAAIVTRIKFIGDDN